MNQQAKEVVARALQNRLPMSLYFDSTVVIDLIRRRRTSSLKLAETARENKWKCVTSYFSYMEAFNVEQDTMFFNVKVAEGDDVDSILRRRYDRDLDAKQLVKTERKVYEGIKTTYDFIDWVYLEEEGWNKAIDLCAETNISTSDCIHLATALITGCLLLITSDEPFKKKANDHIPSITPEEMPQILQAIAKSSS